MIYGFVGLGGYTCQVDILGVTRDKNGTAKKMPATTSVLVVEGLVLPALMQATVGRMENEAAGERNFGNFAKVTETMRTKTDMVRIDKGLDIVEGFDANESPPAQRPGGRVAPPIVTLACAGAT